MLLAAEQRALQLCEGQLYKLMEGGLDDRDAAEKVLLQLARMETPDRSEVAVPLCVEARVHSLPSRLRPHLQWLIRTLILLREPPILSWLLSLRAVRSRADEAWLASSVTALLDSLNPADEQRHRALLSTLCTLELHQLHTCAGVLVPNSFFSRLASEHLCRLPAARRCLHRALRGPLEAWLDAPRRVDDAFGR